MSLQQSSISLTPATVSQISDILTDFLSQCNIAYPHNIQLDPVFNAACYADAARRGFDMRLLKKALDVGIAIGDTGYRHLKSFPARVFIAVWTCLMTHVDDYYETYSDGLEAFFDRFIRRQPQCYKALDDVAAMIYEIPDHWEAITANLIFTAEIDFLTSSMIDSTIEGMEIQTSMAPGFPLFTRSMSGISRAYAVMVFPPNKDLKTWIQVIPDFMHYINHVNDLLSFFKEELAGETLNFISLSASSDGISKIEALRKLADETAQAYDRGAKLLRSCPEAYEAYRAFAVGYIGFHALSVRYKLDQLSL